MVSITAPPNKPLVPRVVGILFGAWEFYGYNTSVHLAEETNEASEVVAKGMWAGTLVTWLLSVPTLVILLFCICDSDAIVNGTYANNFAELRLQALGPKGATTVLTLCWLDSTCGTIICILSAQRVTYATSRDGILPGQGTSASFPQIREYLSTLPCSSWLSELQLAASSSDPRSHSSP